MAYVSDLTLKSCVIYQQDVKVNVVSSSYTNWLPTRDTNKPFILAVGAVIRLRYCCFVSSILRFRMFVTTTQSYQHCNHWTMGNHPGRFEAGGKMPFRHCRGF